MLCGTAALGLWAASAWLAVNWLNVEALPVETVGHAIAIMGFVAALQVMEGLYAGSIAGLERQVTQNIIMSAMATLRGAGGALVVMFVAPDIAVFFKWQGCVAVLATALMGVVFSVFATSRALWAVLNTRHPRSRALYEWDGRVAVLVLLLTQVDKILLTKSAAGEFAPTTCWPAWSPQRSSLCIAPSSQLSTRGWQPFGHARQRMRS